MPIKTSSGKAFIDPKTYPLHTKQELWAGIKKINPDLAEMLAMDKNISDLKNSFGAFVVFNEADFNKYINAGKQFFKEREHEQHRVLQNQ